MSNGIDAAISELTTKLQALMNEVSETKRAINVLLKINGREPRFLDEVPEQVGSALSIEPDQYYGRPLATCVQEFLEQRNKATGKRAVDVADILKALESGGFDFKAQGWRDSDRLRSLSISLAKNTKVFHRLPNNGPFGLLSWYPDVAAKREQKEKSEPVTEAEAEPEGSNATAA